MFDKIKEWLFGNVILEKVVGKFIKHGVGVIIAFISPYLTNTGIQVDWAKFETWATITIVGLFGAGWNYIQHRFFEKEKKK